MNPSEIIELLEAPESDPRPTVYDLLDRIESHELVDALRIAVHDKTKNALIDLLGDRAEQAALPLLVASLNADSSEVRAAAADALAKIGDRTAGPDVAAQLSTEADTGVQHMLLLAVGATGYTDGAEDVAKWLSHENKVARGCAAWSLGALQAAEYLPALEELFAREERGYAFDRAREAIAAIKGQESAE